MGALFALNQSNKIGGRLQETFFEGEFDGALAPNPMRHPQ